MIINKQTKDYTKLFLPDIPVKTAIKLGKYSFMNCLPVNLPMQQIPEDIIKSYFGVPSTINELLNNGSIDIGPISSAEYLRNKDNFNLFDNISISSQREVGSVILLSNKDIEELGGANIAVTHTSATSSLLLRLLIKIKAGSDAKYTLHHLDSSPESLLNEFDAVLFIGDPALEVNFNFKDKTSVKTFDMANLWYRHFNLPMVFGVWVVRKDYAEKNPELVRYINNCLIKAKSIGLNELFKDVLNNAKSFSNLPDDYLTWYYLNQLNYDFNSLHRRSLDLFYSKLREFKLF